MGILDDLPGEQREFRCLFEALWKPHHVDERIADPVGRTGHHRRLEDAGRNFRRRAAQTRRAAGNDGHFVLQIHDVPAICHGIRLVRSRGGYLPLRGVCRRSAAARSIWHRMATPFRYCPDAVDSADFLLDWCEREPSWRTERIRFFGRMQTVPRLVAWYGDPGIAYRYSGLDHRAPGWPEPLDRLRHALSERFVPGLNFVLLNRYRDGRDWMGWHRDDEREIGDRVVSVSLGATRRLRLELGDRKVALELQHGSVLVFDGAVRHALVRTRSPVGQRINLTFRHINAA